MWTFSRTAVPPEVNSRSRVALFMFVLSVSQCPTKDFSFSNASVPPPAAGFGTGMTPMPNTTTVKTFVQPLIDRPPLKYWFALSRMDHANHGAYRAATAVRAVLPNRCVANPTIAPRSIPGIIMSQNNAIPARRITRRLNIAAIAIPAKIPSSMEWTRSETYPVTTPATNPFNNEKVITLPMTGASAGSKNPLKPSRSPRVPPTASPSTGFRRLIVPSSCESVMHSLGVLVGLHHAKEVSFCVFAIGKISDAGNGSLRHHQFSTSALCCLDGRVDRIHADGVGGGLYIRILYEATVDPRCSLGPRGHQPILHGPRPFFNLPAECFLIERRSALRITRQYFKMDDSRHVFPLVLQTKFLTFPKSGSNASPALLPELLRTSAWHIRQSLRPGFREQCFGHTSASR